jgi:hypothetical protein
MREVACGQFRVEGHEFLPDATLRVGAAELARQKYSQNDYNQKR